MRPSWGRSSIWESAALALPEIGVRLPACPPRQDSSPVERRAEDAGVGGSIPPPDAAGSPGCRTRSSDARWCSGSTAPCYGVRCGFESRLGSQSDSDRHAGMPQSGRRATLRTSWATAPMRVRLPLPAPRSRSSAGRSMRLRSARPRVRLAPGTPVPWRDHNLPGCCNGKTDGVESAGAGLAMRVRVPLPVQGLRDPSRSCSSTGESAGPRSRRLHVRVVPGTPRPYGVRESAHCPVTAEVGVRFPIGSPTAGVM